MLKLGSKNVSKLFLGGRAIANAYLGNRLVWQASQPLPYDAEVEYLESTGTQYIDTGLPVSQGYRFVSEIAFVGRTISGGNAINSFWYAQAGFNVFQCSPSIMTPATTSNGLPTIDTSGNVFYSVDQRLFAGDKSTTLDGVLIATSTTTMIVKITGKNYLIFASFNASDIIRYGFVRCKHFTMYNADGQALIDFIPVRFTNELGESEGAMYDRVSGALFRNAGTGAFVVGPDINPISARSYVNDGLIAMWDGIENAGWGQHNSSATTWKDLIGTNDLDTMNSNTFGDNCALITDARLGIGSSDKHIDLYTGTVEMVCEAAPMGRASFLRLGNTNSSSYSLGISYTNNPGSVSGIGGNITTTGATFSTSQRHFAATYDGTTYLMYVDGVPATINATSFRTYGNITIGGVGGRTYSLNGKVYSVRVYNRVLTAQEIAANYAIDKARFNLP